MKANLTAAVAATLVLASAQNAEAGSVTPDIIFGSGNDNGSFTINTVSFGTLGDVELGLRAKLRFDDQSSCSAFSGAFTNIGCPQNTFNWDGNSTYSFNVGDGNPPPGFAMWNFEWAAYSTVGPVENFPAPAGLRLEFDTDPSSNTSFTSYDPLAFDAWYGTDSTGNGAGTYVPNTTPPGSSVPLAGATVAQNSVNYGFIGAPVGPGIYDIRLSVLNTSGIVAGSTDITVNVVPVPPALPLLAAGVGGLAWLSRRRRKTAQG